LRVSLHKFTHEARHLSGSCILENEAMEETQVERRKLVTLPQEEFEAMLERAAERGARHALSEVGLDGPEAARDISELRSLLDAFNEAKKTAGLTIVRMLVTGLVLALLAGAFVKLKVFGGGQ
jgi:sugar phosphate isomerase/epimerase